MNEVTAEATVDVDAPRSEGQGMDVGRVAGIDPMGDDKALRAVGEDGLVAELGGCLGLAPADRPRVAIGQDQAIGDGALARKAGGGRGDDPLCACSSWINWATWARPGRSPP
jgi:hypothetical protein